jgi:hypothetical protein
MFSGFRRLARLIRVSDRHPKSRPLFLEPLEHRLVLTTNPYFMMPVELQTKQGAAVSVPVSISGLFDQPGVIAGNRGLKSGRIVLTYDSRVFSVADSDVTEGALLTNPPADGAWSFTVNTATPGEIDIAFASPSLAADLGRSGAGVLANINFHVNAEAPEGESGIRVIAFPKLSPNGLSSIAIPDIGPYSVQGDGSGYDLYAADQVDGIVEVLNAQDAPPAITSASAVTFTAGIFNSFTVTTTGRPAPNFSHTTSLYLPQGVNFVDNGDGTATISGTPGLGSGGVYQSIFTAFNGVDPQVNRSFTLTVNETPFIITPNHATLDLGAGSFAIQAYGYPRPTFTVTGNLSAAVVFTSQANGVALLQEVVPSSIGFLPNTLGDFPVTITASNGLAPDATQQFTLTITGIPSFATTPNQKFIAQVYLDLFHRVVDPNGLQLFSTPLDQGVSRAQVVLDIEHNISNVFQSIEIKLLYERYLHRQANDNGLYDFITLLHNGGTTQQVSAFILGSPEYFQNRAGGSNQGFLEALYQDVLNRPIDPGALAFGLANLAQGGDRTAFALFVLQSREANRVLVQSTYEAILNRQADPGGLAFFTQALQTGATYEQLVAVLMASQEYAQNRVGGV